MRADQRSAAAFAVPGQLPAIRAHDDRLVDSAAAASASLGSRLLSRLREPREEAAFGAASFFLARSADENVSLDPLGPAVLVVGQGRDALGGALYRVWRVRHRDREPGLGEHVEVVVHIAQHGDLIAGGIVTCSITVRSGSTIEPPL